MERDCESELSKLNIEQNACIYHFGASVIHGQRSNILRLQYNNIREARKAIGKYVHTYNFERCHSALNNQTPASCYYPILLLDDHAA